MNPKENPPGKTITLNEAICDALSELQKKFPDHQLELKKLALRYTNVVNRILDLNPELTTVEDSPLCEPIKAVPIENFPSEIQLAILEARIDIGFGLFFGDIALGRVELMGIKD